MRKLEVSKRFGRVYMEHSPPGALAIFCPSCPQPGINLPPNWKDLPDWVTRRTITIDGNFHADHIKMRRPDLDIALTNGDGYMVEDSQYREYLSVAKEPRFVGLSINILGFSFSDLSYRDLPVAITELSTLPIPIIDVISTLLVLLPAVVQDMDVLSQLPSATCKWVNGKGVHPSLNNKED
jgi:hypothetical protein